MNERNLRSIDRLAIPDLAAIFAMDSGFSMLSCIRRIHVSRSEFPVVSAARPANGCKVLKCRMRSCSKMSATVISLAEDKCFDSIESVTSTVAPIPAQVTINPASTAKADSALNNPKLSRNAAQFSQWVVCFASSSTLPKIAVTYAVQRTSTQFLSSVPVL